MRKSILGLQRKILTTETAKHRVFEFSYPPELAEGTVATFAFEDAFIIGTLSASIHVTWALAAGGRLGMGNDPRYNKTRCFETFPFPDPDEPTRSAIRELGERLDAHRKRQQELHPELTLTGMYNVLEKLRADETLTDKERVIHDDGLVSILKQIHDDLDQAVFHAYGWDDLWTRFADPAEDRDVVENELLERLVALNHERAEEEKNGKIRWLRPDFQNPDGDEVEETQGQLDIPKAKKKAEKTKAAAKQKWPDTLPDQVAAVLSAIAETGQNAENISTLFGRKSAKREEQIAQVIATLESLGKL